MSDKPEPTAEPRTSYSHLAATHASVCNEIMYQKDLGTANGDFLADLEKLRLALRAVMRYY